MINQAEYLDLIVRYLNHPQDQNLANEIKSLREKSLENDSFFLEVEKVWQLSSRSKVLDRLNEKESLANFKRGLSHISPRPIRLIKWLASAAALLLIGGGFWYYNANIPAELLIFNTGNQIDSISLADCSKVILSKNTTIKYPKVFENKQREIFLTQGKAFFRITKDPEHPFSVLMGVSKVSVLGTSFNINYSANKIDLDVKTGRVMFSPYKNATASILTAGQALTYTVNTKDLSTHHSQNSDSWLTNQLIFVDTPLDLVCKQLNDYFHSEIYIDGDALKTKKLNANFNDSSLEDVLSVLKKTYNIRIKKENNQIILTKQ